jgi:hypothetical protein
VEAFFGPEEDTGVLRVAPAGRVDLLGLSRYGGGFVTDDPELCLCPGMVVGITIWSSWAAEPPLRAQLTSYCEGEPVARPLSVPWRAVCRDAGR